MSSRKWSRIDLIGQNGNTGEHYMEEKKEEPKSFCPLRCCNKTCKYHRNGASFDQVCYWLVDKPTDCEIYEPCPD